jgi:hypothetical protein
MIPVNLLLQLNLNEFQSRFIVQVAFEELISWARISHWDPPVRKPIPIPTQPLTSFRNYS